MLHACCSQKKEKVHKQASTQMSYIAFKSKRTLRCALALTLWTFFHGCCQLVSPISPWLGVVLATRCCWGPAELWWYNAIEQWSFRKHQIACWNSSRTWFLPLQSRGHWAGRKGGGTQTQQYTSRQHLPLAVLGLPSAHGRAAMQSPLSVLGARMFPWHCLESPFCLHEGWKWRQGSPWCVRVSPWLSDLDQLCSKPGACPAVALHEELWSVLRGMEHFLLLGGAVSCSWCDWAVPTVTVASQSSWKHLCARKPVWKQAGKLRLETRGNHDWDLWQSHKTCQVVEVGAGIAFTPCGCRPCVVLHVFVS